MSRVLEETAVPEVRLETKEEELSRTPAFDLEGPQPSTSSTKLEPESSLDFEHVDSGFQGR